MKRRQALKHIGLSTGFVVATPTLISLLQSCTAEADAWQPRFLTVDQGKMVTALVDVFLPRTDLPSAGDLNIAQFIDGYYQEIVMAEEQVRLVTGRHRLKPALQGRAVGLGNGQRADQQLRLGLRFAGCRQSSGAGANDWGSPQQLAWTTEQCHRRHRRHRGSRALRRRTRGGRRDRCGRRGLRAVPRARSAAGSRARRAR